MWPAVRYDNIVNYQIFLNTGGNTNQIKATTSLQV